MKRIFQSLIIILFFGLSFQLKSSPSSCDPLLKLLETTLNDATHGPVWKAFLDESGEVGSKTFEILSTINLIAVRSNPATMQGIRTAIQRGVKSIDEITLYAGVPHINASSVTHIFRGDGFNQGRHHISALINDKSIKLTHKVDLGNGFYKASLKKGDLTMNDKSFFPDSMSEFEVIDAIKAAYDSNPVKNIENTVTFIGQWQNMNIKIVKENGIIKSAYLD